MPDTLPVMRMQCGCTCWAILLACCHHGSTIATKHTAHNLAKIKTLFPFPTLLMGTPVLKGGTKPSRNSGHTPGPDSQGPCLVHNTSKHCNQPQ